MNLWDAEACGNTFRVVLTDTPDQARAYARTLRNANTWDFDSLLVLAPAEDASVTMLVLEADGSESVMCGNGCRAVAAILDSLELPRTIRAGNQVLSVDHEEAGEYRVRMGAVNFLGEVTRQNTETSQSFLAYSAAGEPHHVVIVDDLDSAPVEIWGKLTTPHANCTVVEVTGTNSLRAVTYERGVNRITESCGTGACSAAQAVRRAQNVPSTTFTIHMHDHMLTVSMDGDQTYLQGPATFKRREEF